MASAGESATGRFVIDLDGNAAEKATADAAALEQLRAKIAGSQEAVKQLSSAYRALRGSSDEVKAAKERLSAKLTAEKDAISGANLKLLTLGTTYEKVAGDAKKLTVANDNGTKGLKLAGGPLESLKGKFDSLREALSGEGAAMNALALTAGITIAAIVALTGVVVGLTVAFVKFVVTAGDAQRSLELTREAFLGNEQNARNLGTQVDALAGKVSTSKDKLNDLATQLTRTRLGGQAVVDTFNLVGQASAAMGDDVGKQLQDLVTRGQRMKRFQINPIELQGTGLKFQDIAGELAANLHVGVKDAQQALFEGRVKLDDGAKALRGAVEKRFAEINLKKMLSLGVQAEKFHERLSALTTGVNLEPLLKGIDELSKLFDQSTFSGQALKQITTIFGNEVVSLFSKGLPIAKAYFKGLVIGALLVTIEFLKLKKQFKETFGGDTGKSLDLVGYSLRYAAGLGKILAGALERVASALRLIKDVKDAVAGTGGGIVDGLSAGIEGGEGKVTSVVSELADKVKSAFANVLQIKSPSRVFARLGGHLPGGLAMGVRQGAPRAHAAAGAMAGGVARAALVGVAGGRFGAVAGARAGFTAPGGVARRAGASFRAQAAATPAPAFAAFPPRAARQAAAGGGGGGVTVNLGGVQIAGGGRANPQEVQKRASSSSFRAELTRFLEEELLGQGIPTQAEASP